MFKDKNKFEKLSNGLLIVMIALYFLSALTLVLGSYDSTLIEKVDYNYNLIMYIIYTLIGIAILFVTNKYIKLYKDDYSTSKKLFNLVIMLSFYSLILMIISYFVEYFVYGNFELIGLCSVIFGYVPCYVVAYLESNKMLVNTNDKKTNVTNFIVIYLLMEYFMSSILTLLNMLFNVGDAVELFRNLCLSLIFICVVLMAYKMSLTTNKVNKENELKKEEAKPELVKKDEIKEAVIVENTPEEKVSEVVTPVKKQAKKITTKKETSKSNKSNSKTGTKAKTSTKTKSSTKTKTKTSTKKTTNNTKVK